MAFTIPKTYELLMSEELSDIQSTGYILRHKKSGARVVLVENNEENKVFSIGFRTPPKDSTGVAHIVEHTTLCGSDKYPAKDPFIELAKGSLNTFLNAMTFSDKTIYPIASCNDKDFANLMSVYMDAVFHPQMYHNEKLFLQEGWHYELTDLESPLIYNGVVYNEMKGAFSSPDELIGYYTTMHLYPDTPYRVESGGYPAAIPDLTYEEFLNFHRSYYHPSNSYIYLYGAMDFTERLNYMDEEYLSKYDTLFVDSSVPLQKPLTKVETIQEYYGITEDESEENNSYFAWTKVLCEGTDPVKYLAFQVLEYVLLQSSGAIIMENLQKAGIGENVYGGLSTSFRQNMFEIIAKGTDTKRFDEFIQIIEDTLKTACEDKISKKTLLAGINSLEFRMREADFGSYPAGLMYAIQAYETWLHDDYAPFVHLNYGTSFARLRELVDTDYFENLISTYLLNNTHGCNLCLVPKKGLTKEEEDRVSAVLAKKKASMSKEELEEIIAKTKELKEFQATPSTKEELEQIPLLSVSDIRKEATPLCYEEDRISDTLVLHTPVSTHGISYLDLYFDLSRFTLEEIPYLVILGTVLADMDTKNFNYADLSDEIAVKLGGLSTQTRQFNEIKTGTPKLFMEVRVKSLENAKLDAYRILEEVLLRTDFTDEKHLYDLVMRKKAQMQSMINGRGHTVSATRAASYFDQAAYLSDLRIGVAMYEFLEKLVADFDNAKTDLISKLQSLSKRVFTKKNLIINATVDDYEDLAKTLPDFISVLPEGADETVKNWSKELTAKNEGLCTAAQIQYVARAGAYDIDKYKDATEGAFDVLKVVMNYEYLWNNIRVLGGAYGCFANFTNYGTMAFASYRDPQLLKTNEVFDGVADYVEKIELSDRDMTKYIIGAIAALDVPKNAIAKGESAMIAKQTGYTTVDLQAERDDILSMTPAKLRSLSNPIREAMKTTNLCVIGNSEKIKEASDLFGEVKALFH